MSVYRIIRSAIGKCLRAIHWRRRVLTKEQKYWAAYKVISLRKARRQKAIAWETPQAAALQDAAYRNLLNRMYSGTPRIDLVAAAEAVDAVGLAHPSLLEIGCGSGYYKEIFDNLAKCKVGYTGLDYSAAMIALAKKRYPGVNFEMGDATALRFADGAFDIVFNGVSLMHILEYEKAIAESARVARQAAIFHSTAVFIDHPTTFLRKFAYGGPMVEAVFNRAELLRYFERYGLQLVKSWRTTKYDVGFVVGSPSHAETFLCEKFVNRTIQRRTSEASWAAYSNETAAPPLSSERRI